MSDNALGKKLKAYKLGCHDGDHGQRVVFATSGKSLRGCRGSDFCGCEYIDLQVLRAPEFDDVAPGPVTIEQYLARGWYWECGGCHQHVTSDDTPVIIGDHVYHSAECVERDRKDLSGFDPARCHESLIQHIANLDAFLLSR